MPNTEGYLSTYYKWELVVLPKWPQGLGGEGSRRAQDPRAALTQYSGLTAHGKLKTKLIHFFGLRQWCSTHSQYVCEQAGVLEEKVEPQKC